MKVEEKLIFENIWQLIENNEFSTAEKQLSDICSDTHSSEESVSYANYMIGCIHTAWNNKDKKTHIAHRALLCCIESSYSIPKAYFHYADIQEDKNVAINYLKEGLQKFPDSPSIYSGLLKHTSGSEKVKCIDEIDSKNIMDVQLLESAIDFLISTNDWVRSECFLQKVLSVSDISDYHKLFCTLLYSFSLVTQNKDVDIAKQNFKNIMEQDISNELKYSHHMGYLWCLLNSNEVDEAVMIFDKIPISSAFEDLIDGPWCPIYADFSTVYKNIFSQLRIVFAKDKKRKLKTDALEAYYLYTPSKYYDIYRYEKKHVKYLSNYLSIDKKNLNVSCALFNMQVHFKQFYDAYCSLMNILGEYLDPEKNDIYEVNFYEECKETEILKICDDIINKLTNGFDMDIGKYMTYVFEPLVNVIYNSKLQDKHKLIVSLAKQLNPTYLFKSDYKFEIAYSYAHLNPLSYDAEKLYLDIIKEEQNNASAINNVGVIYEKRGHLNKAVDYFQKAYDISRDEKLYKRNFDRVRGLIRNYEKALTAVKNENVWLLGKLNQIYNSADLQGEFSCRYQDRAKLLTLSPQKATEVFDKMLKNGYFEKVSSDDVYQVNRYAVNPLIKEYLINENDRLKRNEPYEEIANGLNYDEIVRLGYSQMVESAIDSIPDLDFKEILVRDVKEAAITLTTKQYKSCIVMCGSAIEAILSSKIISSGYQKYDIGSLTKNKSNIKKVLEMDLNELLELAKKECLIDIGEYHLSNFVRCYRNIIHPSVEIRKKYDANENNARMMWNALLLIIKQVI